MTTITLKAHHEYTATIACLTYNQPVLTQQLADALHPYLLVIDNGSEPPITPPARTPHSVIRIPENRYFTGGWNYAMQFFETTWVAMLNEDITGIDIHMIDKLILEAQAHDYAVISPAFNSPHAESCCQHVGLRRVASIDWVAPIIRKDAWDAVGGFDEVNFKGWGAELDLAYKLNKGGYRMAVDDRHVIHHIGSAAAYHGNTMHIQNNVATMNAAFQRLYGVQDWAEFVRGYLG